MGKSVSFSRHVTLLGVFQIFSIYSTILFIASTILFITNCLLIGPYSGSPPFLGVHHGKLHPLWDIEWGDTSFDINAFKAHSKQKDIKQDDCIHYGTLDGAILLLISMLLRLILNKKILNRMIASTMGHLMGRYFF